MEVDKVERAQRRKLTPICAIGASAGGISALRAFFQHITPDLGLAYVVIIHLSPDHPSQLSEILAACTTMTVRQVEDSPELRPNCVYVIAPDSELVIDGETVTARPFSEARGHRAPIDMFFRSVASARGDSFAVVLSGAGSDGKIGARAIKEAGGVVFVQEPADAEYAMMPRSVISTGIADFVGPVPRLTERIAEVMRSKEVVRQLDETEANRDFRRIVNFLRKRTGHDFSNYKHATILRRVLRRMQVTRRTSLADYADYVAGTPEEAQDLFGDLLISVTLFFRDAEAFTALTDHVIGSLFEQADEQAGLRVWCAGCATGEEAYSIAILFLEEARRRRVSVPIQIFATDLDEGALATAREGRYPKAIEADVSEERLSEFFVPEGSHYRVRKELRDIVLFASHSVLKDPPFLRLDLVTCRNLLIYLNRDLQKQVTTLFHYGLRAGGYLFLGSAETLDFSPDLFEVIDREARIYLAKPVAGRALPVFKHLPGDDGPDLTGPVHAAPSGGSRSGALHGGALERDAPPSILVDRDRRALHLSETAGRFILPSAGPFTQDVAAIVRPELRLDLQTALARAFQEAKPTLTLPVPVAFNGSSQRIVMHVTPTKASDEGSLHALVFFLDGGAIEDLEVAHGEAASDEVRRLQAELRATLERLAESRGGHDTAIQELRAANEELQSINEEYRSTSEELETSKEELQSMNEELQTVNAELKSKLTSISSAHSDLQNLIQSTDIGTLFLDTTMHIRMFTPRIANLFNITDSDVGRTISDFTHRLAYERLAEDVERVMRDLAPVEIEVASKDGKWFMLRLRPYRTIDDRIDGIVATFVDISARREAEERLRESQRLLAIATAASGLGWGTWNFATGRAEWDDRGREILGLSKSDTRPEDWLGRIVGEDRPTVTEHVNAHARQGTPFDVPYRIVHHAGEIRHVQLSGVFQTGEDGTPFLGTGLVRDITELKSWEASQQLLVGELNHRVKNMLAVVQSIAHQTQRNTDDPQGFVEAFESRLAALVNAHAILTKRNWANVRFDELAATVLTSLDDGAEKRIAIDGPLVRLSPNATITLAMGLHELGTNAIKYGALSASEGQVRLTWRIDGGRLFLTWSEHDGPPVQPPARKGFGQALLEKGIARELNAEVRLAYPESGLIYTLEAPLDGSFQAA